jgi:DNA-directed RNA polymerase subunit RPC12/RpoP
MTNTTRQTSDKSPTLKRDKPTTLNPAYRCDDCGEPAMVVELDRFFSCPECYLKRLGEKIKGLDHSGYYP